MKQLSKVLPLHSFGSCLHTRDLEKELPACAQYTRIHANRDPVKECTLHHYKFYLAFENSQSPGYVTEKLWQALKMGSVPIYWGAQDIDAAMVLGYRHPVGPLKLTDF